MRGASGSSPKCPILPAWYTASTRRSAVGNSANANSDTLKDGGKGRTQLTVEKKYDLLTGVFGSNLAELWDGYWGGIAYDTVVITNVDANTTILGGSNKNTFAISGNDVGLLLMLGLIILPVPFFLSALAPRG